MRFHGSPHLRGPHEYSKVKYRLERVGALQGSIKGFGQANGGCSFWGGDGHMREDLMAPAGGRALAEAGEAISRRHGTHLSLKPSCSLPHALCTNGLLAAGSQREHLCCCMDDSSCDVSMLCMSMPEICMQYMRRCSTSQLGWSITLWGWWERLCHGTTPSTMCSIP